MGSGAGGESLVALNIPGVGFEIFVGCKLGGIDEVAYHNDIVPGFCPADKRQVPFVQESHRWNKTDCFTRLTMGI